MEKARLFYSRALFLIVCLFIFVGFFFAAFQEIFGQKEDMYKDHGKIHKRRGIGRQQEAVYDERNTTHQIDHAGLDLIAR